MRSHFILIALLFLIPTSYAKEPAWPAKLGEWTLNGSSPRNSAEINEASKKDALFREAGLTGVTYRTYAQGARTLYLTLYSFHDSSGAYEALDVLRLHLVKDFEHPGETIYRSNQILYIESDTKLEDLFRSDAAKWVTSISDGVAAPPIATYLPRQNRITEADVYALGPVAFTRMAQELGSPSAATLVDHVGFNSGAEAVFAKYKAGKDEATLLLIEYPTPQLAGQHLKHLEQALTPEMRKAGTTIAQRASLLSIMLAPTSPEYAQKLRDAVSYDTEVTWNEPTHTLTDPPLLSTVGKIILFTCGFMLVAFVLGLAFGGVRILTKIFFPGKVFDRPEKMDVLQLGLTDKPIDFRDFY